jgi:uncharacterized membrane protein YcaP (DUF421 family)
VNIVPAIENALGLGLKAEELGAGNMSLRAVIIFSSAAVMIRLGSKRFMGQSTALDVMLGIIFGSVVSRAITGNAAFVPALSAGLTLILLHWLLSALTFRSHWLGNIIKGRSRLLVENGRIDWKAMARSQITEHDLAEALRSHGHPAEISRLETAYLERDGRISVVMRGIDRHAK